MRDSDEEQQWRYEPREAHRRPRAAPLVRGPPRPALGPEVFRRAAAAREEEEPVSATDQQAASYRALRLAVKLLADTAMRCGDAGEAANFTLAALRLEFEYRFELLRSRRAWPDLIEPEPLPATAVPSDQA